MPKRKRISVEKQVQLRELATKRQIENQQVAHDLKIPVKEVEYCLDRAVVEVKKRKRKRSGFDLFKIDWFKKNQGYKAIDKHTSSLISSEWNALSSVEKNEYVEKVKDMPSPTTKKALLPGNSYLYQERNKIANELNSICDRISMELGLETVIFTGSKLPGDSYAGKLGSKTGLNIAKELGWDELQTQVAVKAQNAQITYLPNISVDNPKKNKTLARAYVTKSLNELYIKAGGIGKIQFKNWENQKMEVVGWPDEIPFQEAGKQSKKNLDQIIDYILENKIIFQSF